MTGAGEPPMPGMSNRMTPRRESSASTNGWSSSRLTPMPLHRSSGGKPGVPSLTATRIARPPTLRTRIRSADSARSSRPGTIRPGTARARPDRERPFPAGRGQEMLMVIDVCSRRVADPRQAVAAELIRGRPLLPAMLGQPARVVRPPGAMTGLCAPEPVLRILRAVLGHLVSRLLVSGRIDHRGDVPAGGQHEPGVAAEQLGGPVAALPGADVVGDPGDDVTVPVDRGQVHR